MPSELREAFHVNSACHKKSQGKKLTSVDMDHTDQLSKALFYLTRYLADIQIL